MKYGPTSFKWDWECLRKFVDTSKNSPARVFARGEYSVFTYPVKPVPLPHRIIVVFQHSPDYEDVPNIATSGNSVGSSLHPSTFPMAFQETREQWPQLSDNEHPFSYDGACNPVRRAQHLTLATSPRASQSQTKIPSSFHPRPLLLRSRGRTWDRLMGGLGFHSCLCTESPHPETT